MPDYSSLANPNSNEVEETMQNESDIDATFEVTNFSLKLGKISTKTFTYSLFRICLNGLNLLRISIQLMTKKPC